VLYDTDVIPSIDGMEVEKVKSITSSRRMAQPMIISYSSLFCFWVLSNLKLWIRLRWGVNSTSL